MKKCIVVFAAFAFSATVSAQPVAPISATFSAQNLVDQIDVGRQVYNVDLCKRVGVTGTCNQNNVCAASFAATGQPASGAACTANEAQAAGVRFYPATNTGLQNFLEIEVVKPLIPSFKEAKALQARENARTKCVAANKAAKDAICAAFDMAADCGLCDAFQ